MQESDTGYTPISLSSFGFILKKILNELLMIKWMKWIKCTKLECCLSLLVDVFRYRCPTHPVSLYASQENENHKLFVDDDVIGLFRRSVLPC